jgi:hypothetical protein
MSNPDLIYIWNPERETKLCYDIPPLENLHQLPQYRDKIIFMSSHLLYYRTDVPQIRARRGEGCQIVIDGKLFFAKL